MQPLISVILCTHNPRQDYFSSVLAALKQQTLPVQQWELCVIDNASDSPLSDRANPDLDLSWHPHAVIIQEPQLGLTHARLCGFRASNADLIVFVDDDNVLAQNYLAQVVQIFQEYPQLGAIAGKSLPQFEVEPEPWIRSYDSVLALRDFGETPLTTARAGSTLTATSYPAFAPCGAGMALRRQLFATYNDQVANHPVRLALGRTGQQLTSGEDNDIILTLLAAGWEVGYFPQLHLTHLIASHRVQPDYLARLNYAASRSWVQVLGIHGIQPWKKIAAWTVLLRQMKVAFRYQPWRSSHAYVQWRGACGTFAGQSLLP
ncbi:glycosyltransferase [Leptolyngbya ohadii]|uniref:glycosyltransferase n=1 Tax=Leptolyngbya ohadii TaxID=1962290 RepID=UPI000B59F6E3|nr:glycosyltransferase [Leptolyngbya ohadii]